MYITSFRSIPYLAFVLVITNGPSNHVKADTMTYKLTSPTRSILLKDPSPIGISIEFFTFPDYMTKVKNTAQCISNLADVLGTPVPIRIGGTTQDYGTYDPNLTEAISYKLHPADKGVPKSLTYGPEFIRLASTIPGPVTIGLNRKSNNLPNAILASQEILRQIPGLYALEFGNEPEYWTSSQPIAQGKPWNAQADRASQINWQQEIGKALDRKNFVQAGNHLDKFKVSDLAHAEGDNAAYVKSFGIHSYPQNTCGNSNADIPYLMNHSKIVEYMNRFKEDLQATSALNKPAHFSETNSVACGGAAKVSPTFGAALWTMDYIIQSLLLGVQRLYFHHGTLGNSQYSFWGRYSVSSPFYGAYFAALALKQVDGISMLDDGTSTLGAYLLTTQTNPTRILLYNSKYRPASSSDLPDQITLDLTGIQIQSTQFKVSRLRAPSSQARADRKNGHPDINGLKFENEACEINSKALKPEFVQLVQNSITLTLASSEAVLIEL